LNGVELHVGAVVATDARAAADNWDFIKNTAGGAFFHLVQNAGFGEHDEALAGAVTCEANEG